MRTLGIYEGDRLVAKLVGSTTECLTLARQKYRSFTYAWRWIV